MEDSTAPWPVHASTGTGGRVPPWGARPRLRGLPARTARQPPAARAARAGSARGCLSAGPPSRDASAAACGHAVRSPARRSAKSQGDGRTLGPPRLPGRPSGASMTLVSAGLAPGVNRAGNLPAACAIAVAPGPDLLVWPGLGLREGLHDLHSRRGRVRGAQCHRQRCGPAQERPAQRHVDHRDRAGAGDQACPPDQHGQQVWRCACLGDIAQHENDEGRGQGMHPELP